MASDQRFVRYTAGQWTQLCELRPGRRALLIDVQNASLILAYNITGPQTQSPLSIGPPGLLVSPNNGNGRPVFRLQAELDGDLVEQNWFAYPLNSTVLPAAPITQSFNANGTWTAPAGVTSADFIGQGCGGSSFASDAVNGACAAGGGGAFASHLGFPVVPGTTYTIQVDPGGQGVAGANRLNTWISNTGVAPLNNAEGVLANSAQNGPVAGPNLPGNGGSAVASIGTLTTAGAPGGAVAGGFLAGNGASGGGGGGAGDATGGGVAGTTGLNGAHPGGAGGSHGGGAGGASDGSASTSGVAGTLSGGNGGGGVSPGGVIGLAVPSLGGLLKVVYTPVSNNVIVVLESFADAPGTNDPNYINPYTPQLAPLPPITPSVLEQLKIMIAKWCP